MYEKPQYMTPDGYRRAKKNPFKSGLPLKEAAERLAKTESKGPADSTQSQKSNGSRNVSPQVARFLKIKQGTLPNKQPAMSEKAALLIAEAIKSLLKSK